MSKPHLKLNLEIYYRDIIFFFGHNVKEMNKVLKKYGTTVPDDLLDHEGNLMGRFYLNSKNQAHIWVPKFPKSPREYGFLQHEINHAVTIILDKLGMTLSGDSEEAYAYLTGYITEKVYEFIAQHHDNKKRKKK